MRGRTLSMCLALWAVVTPLAAQPQTGAVPGSPSTAASFGPQEAAKNGRVAGRVVAADTGKPIARANVMLMGQPSKIVRLATTDNDGRFEFTQVAPGRYGVTPSKEGFVYVSENPFAGGRGIEILGGENLDRTDFALTRGSVITGRITDEFGDPVAGVIVQAARYQFRPSGERQLTMGASGNFYMPASTNDRGEFRIFGLRPGSYYVSARPDSSDPIAVSEPAGGGTVAGVDFADGLSTTFYPGTASPAEAQVVTVSMMQEANASFALVPSRMARVTGTVRDSQGRALTNGVEVSLSQTEGVLNGWFGGFARTAPGTGGTFTLANVAPGNYSVEVRPASAGRGGAPVSVEYASLPLSVSGDDINGLEIVTRPGITVSGRVTFEGNSAIALPNLRIGAVPEDEARNLLSYFGPDSTPVESDGRFAFPSVFGRVVFRTSGLPTTVMLKDVRLNGASIIDTAFDATGSENVTDLEIVLTDKVGRISGFCRNARGEVQYNYRLVLYPANPRDGDVTVRFQHNTSPNVKGQFNIGRMPPGEYVGLAVRGVQPGEEWDPELRKRIEAQGRRFTLKEGEALELEFPYVE